MAYTKIHAIKATVDKAIDYICNPEKTDEKMFVSSYACSPETAAYDFKYTLDHCRENSPNKAYHLIQAFAPGEVGFEEAHLIGKELADKLLEGKYSYVVTTHIDKGHVHNHIIFCAADNIEHNKYHDCKQSYYHIRNLSDELCKEHNLSVIIPGAQRGKKYKEWQSDQNGSAWKTQIRKDINFCIKSASTYEEFLLLMRAKGYEIKGETFEEGAAKYISFRPLIPVCASVVSAVQSLQDVPFTAVPSMKHRCGIAEMPPIRASITVLTVSRCMSPFWKMLFLKPTSCWQEALMM